MTCIPEQPDRGHPAIRIRMRVILPTVLLAISAMAPRAEAVEQKIGWTLAVTLQDGFSLNPVVAKVLVKEVKRGSPAEAAGIAAGDEIVQVEGQPVVGKRALALKPYLSVDPGESRSLRVKHQNGDEVDAKITKPKE